MAGVVALDSALADGQAALGTASADGRWRIAWSGRLDNRDAFAGRFGGLLATSDAQLVADAISSGGADGIAALGVAIGDFAVAAWDSTDRRLWLARDAIGFRPLFYLHEPDRVWFTTDLGWLMSGAARGRSINEGYIAEFLAGNIVSVDQTPIDGVRRVLPAEALAFELGKPAPARRELWRPPLAIPNRRTDAALIEEFRERFSTAVARSVGDEPTLSAQLSGGLDSTSVVSTVKSLTGNAPDAYSLVYPSFPRALGGEVLDESLFIDEAVAALGCRSVRFDPLGANGLGRRDFLRVLTAHGDIPDFPVTDALNYALFVRAATDGHRVMLTGLGGDYWLTGSTSRLPALLRGGRWREAWRFYRDVRRPDTMDATPAQLRAHLLSRLAPHWVKTVARAWRSPRVWPPWLPDAYTTRVNLGARLSRLSARVPQVGDDVLQDSLMVLKMSGGLLARESVFRAAADAGIDVRHPMLDRDFVEFVMTLPDDLRMRGAETRFILRQAMGDLLPPGIRERRSKGDATSVVDAAISYVLARRTSIEGRASERGWIDAAMLWPRLRALSFADFRERVPAEGDDHLWFAVAVETWLRERGA